MKTTIRKESIKKLCYIVNGKDKDNKKVDFWLYSNNEKQVLSTVKIMKIKSLKIHLAEVTQLTYAKIIKEIKRRKWNNSIKKTG